MNLQRLFSIMFIVIFSSILCLFLLEQGARIWLTCFASEAAFSQYASREDLIDRYGQTLWSPHRYLGYCPTPDYENPQKENRHNSLGFRGEDIIMPKSEQECRIVCIGGSTTYTIFSGYRESYPYLLQEKLIDLGYENVKVINAGVPGWTTWESLINLQFRVLDLSPDIIIIYHAINDVYARLVWPPECYRGDNSGYRIPKERLPDYVEDISLLRMLSVRMGLTSPCMDLSSLDGHPGTYYGDDLHAQLYSANLPSGLFANLPPQAILEKNNAKYYESNIESMIAIAKRRGIKVVLATFAYAPEFDDYAWEMQNIFQPSVDEMNETLKRIAEEEGVSLFDFASVFPKDTAYFVDSTHVNPKGSALKAQMFATYIHGNSIIPGGGHGRASLDIP